MKRRNPISAVVRVLPTFLLLSVVGCGVAYLGFKVPLDELGVAVSVPLVVGFLLTRILVLIVPPGEAPERHPSLDELAVAAAFLVCLLSGAVLLLSVGPYEMLGMQDLAKASGKAGLVVLQLFLVGSLAVTISKGLSIPQLLAIYAARTARMFWELLRVPRNLSFRIYGHHLDSIH